MALELAGGSGGHPRFASFPVFLDSETGDYVGNALNAGALTTQSMTSGQNDFLPVCFPIDFQFDRLQIEQTTAAGGGEATVTVCLFANDDNKLVVPGGDPLETWTFNPGGANGAKTFTPAASARILRGGILYWVGIQCSLGAPAFRAVPVSASLPISHPADPSLPPNTVLRGASTLPALPGSFAKVAINPYSLRFRRG